MNYSKMIGFPKPVPPALKGIGDEPMPASDGATMIMHKPVKVSMHHGVKVDQHSSFPKGLPTTFRVHDEHVR